MEDAIVEKPGKYIGEKNLKLVARQYRMGNYIFDLLFEDRHGGKLIVEIQKGTLDRTHTYKILDYYHEYKEKNPKDFVDIMVVANIIPAERKKRLRDLGIEYKELSENVFIKGEQDLSVITSNKERLSELVTPLQQKKDKMENERNYFKSIGPSIFIDYAHHLLLKVCDSNWKLRGVASLIAEHIPTINAIKEKYNVNFTAQIWMARPYQGNTRCTFEIASKEQKTTDDKKLLRNKIAQSLRSYILKGGLPNETEERTGSTIIATKIKLSRQNDPIQDMNISNNDDIKQVQKVVSFYHFLDKTLDKWNSDNLIDLII